MNWVEWIECCTSPTTRSRRTNNLEEWIGQTECRTIIIIAIIVCDCAIRKLIICWVGRNWIAVQEDERKKNKEHSSPSSVEQIVGKMIIWKTISHQEESRPIRWMTGQKAKDANFLTQESGLVRTDDWLEKANFCATTLQNGLDWLGGCLGGWMEKELDVSIVFVFDIAKASGYSLLLTANWTVLDRWTPLLLRLLLHHRIRLFVLNRPSRRNDAQRNWQTKRLDFAGWGMKENIHHFTKLSIWFELGQWTDFKKSDLKSAFFVFLSYLSAWGYF